MSVNLILGFPFCEHAVGDRVESRHGLFIYEEPPDGLVGLGECGMEFAYGEHIEGCHQECDDYCREAFFLFDAEGVEELAY